MSRNKVNVKMELNKRLDELLRIGEKKTNENRELRHDKNPNRYEGIHSIKTADTYRRTINQLGDFCKQNGVKRMDQINEKVIRDFIHERQTHSKWTHSKDLAAINKVLGTDYTPKQFGIEQRSQNQIIHNRRILTENSTADKARNQDALRFVQATGCRRSSLYKVTSDHAIWNREKTQIIGFEFKEKGGRVRSALVLPSHRETVTEFVQSKINERGEHCRLIDYCDSNANPHFERGVYAQEMYRQMVDCREREQDIYCGERSKFINEENYQKAIRHPRYKADYVRGYNTKICAEISQQLGHNRIDVVINHYLCK